MKGGTTRVYDGRIYVVIFYSEKVERDIAVLKPKVQRRKGTIDIALHDKRAGIFFTVKDVTYRLYNLLILCYAW
jgi:hypothetical protein